MSPEKNSFTRSFLVDYYELEIGKALLRRILNYKQNYFKPTGS